MADESEGKWTMSRPERKRSPWSWLVRLGGLIVLLAVATAAYYTSSGFFNANGTWYGPMHLTKGNTTVSIETFMEVSTSVTGSISGQGTFCIPLPFNNTSTFDYSLSGTHGFSLLGHGTQPPIILTAEYTVPLVLGFRLPIGPSLQMHGNATNSSFHLTAGDRFTATSLDMKHGIKTAFTAACKSLSPLG